MHTILITGASSGLGLSHAIYLTSLGHHVIGTSRNASKIDLNQLKTSFIRDQTKYSYIGKQKNKIKSVKSYLTPQFSSHVEKWIKQIHFITLDITNENSVQQGVQQAITISTKNGWTLDVLINNAGNAYFSSIEDLPIVSVKSQFETNYFGQINMIQAILPWFRKQHSGMIVNTASMAGLIAIPFQGHYCATKAAIMRMSESLRMELDPFNIQVTTLVLGDINTNFNVSTARLHGQSTNTTSLDLENLLKSNATNPNSPYFKISQNPWRRIVQNLVVSPSPISVSRNLGKIIEQSKPKIHNIIGSASQRLQMWLLRRVVSDDFGVNGAAEFFGIK
jgi:short-subunit dehydrogenase